MALLFLARPDPRFIGASTTGTGGGPRGRGGAAVNVRVYTGCQFIEA